MVNQVTYRRLTHSKAISYDMIYIVPKFEQMKRSSFFHTVSAMSFSRLPLGLQLLLRFQRHLDIFHLSPNATYLFELWANNQLGKGTSTLVEVSTHNDMQEIGKLGN
jgi:hypothetical protein